MRQMGVTPDTDWFCDPRSYIYEGLYIQKDKETPLIIAFL